MTAFYLGLDLIMLRTAAGPLIMKCGRFLGGTFQMIKISPQTPTPAPSSVHFCPQVKLVVSHLSLFFFFFNSFLSDPIPKLVTEHLNIAAGDEKK